MTLVRPAAMRLALMVGVASLMVPAWGGEIGGQELASQQIRWPRAGHELRVTTLPGPPGAVLEGLRDLGLPWDVQPRRDDGRTRFRASFLAGTASTLTLTGERPDATGSFQLSHLGVVERYLGEGHHAKNGAIAGGIVGGLLGTLIVGGLGGGPQDYFAGAAIIGAPFALVGMLVGRIIVTDVWDPVYRNPECVP